MWPFHLKSTKIFSPRQQKETNSDQRVRMACVGTSPNRGQILKIKSNEDNVNENGNAHSKPFRISPSPLFSSPPAGLWQSCLCSPLAPLDSPGCCGAASPASAGAVHLGGAAVAGVQDAHAAHREAEVQQAERRLRPAVPPPPPPPTAKGMGSGTVSPLFPVMGLCRKPPAVDALEDRPRGLGQPLWGVTEGAGSCWGEGGDPSLPPEPRGDGRPFSRGAGWTSSRGTTTSSSRRRPPASACRPCPSPSPCPASSRRWQGRFLPDPPDFSMSRSPGAKTLCRPQVGNEICGEAVD